MKLSKEDMQRLVSCDECYHVFTPDNLTGEEENHLCPVCQETKECGNNTLKELQRKINRLAEKSDVFQLETRLGKFQAKVIRAFEILTK